MTLVSEVCAALFNRTKTGKGDYVRSSLYHNGIFAMGAMVTATQGPDGSVYPRRRPQHGIAFGDFKCKDDRYVYIAAGYAEKLIAKVFSIIGREDLVNDPRFNSYKARVQNSDELYEIISEAMLQRTSEEWLDFAREADIPMVRMQHYSEVTVDEQALVNGYVQDVNYPSGVTFKIASSPIEMDSIGELHTEPTKKIGEDTEAVLKECGYTDEELSEMRKNGII
jgi:crotonobetainyl-CoA:carnitine CoA-transferase CaiB-like acyl-CoA transferase